MTYTLHIILEHCSEWLIDYLPAVFSAFSSTIIAFFMGIYESKPFLQTVSGSIICGIFTIAISGSLEHLGLPENAVNLTGGIIGFIGVDKIREIIKGKLLK